jgi:hypothetical protein
MPHDFTLIAREWCRDQSAMLLGFVWNAYDQMLDDKPPLDGGDLERSITERLFHRIDRTMSRFEPFYLLHEPKERESRKSNRGQPPEYDLAFVLRMDETVMWPLEAKVLETPANISDYVNALLEKFLKCKYAPFCSEGAILGYLLSGSPADAFSAIASEVPCVLSNHPSFTSRPHKLSRHNRSVPTGKSYPVTFHCHHLILEFRGLARTRW